MAEERKGVAEELRKVRDAVRHAHAPTDPALPDPRPFPPAVPLPPPERPAPDPEPPPPDATEVNRVWPAEPERPRRLAGVLFRLLDRLVRPRFEAQRTFNARQVQLDNEMLAHMAERTARTHRHYDHVLGLYGRHLQEIDERHLILQAELVSHVQDLVQRIDLVLAQAERARLSLEHQIGELRRRVEQLEGSRKR